MLHQQEHTKKQITYSQRDFRIGKTKINHLAFPHRIEINHFASTLSCNQDESFQISSTVMGRGSYLEDWREKNREIQVEKREKETSTNSIDGSRRDSGKKPPPAAVLRSGGEGIYRCVTTNEPFLERENCNLTTLEDGDCRWNGYQLGSDFLNRARPDPCKDKTKKPGERN